MRRLGVVVLALACAWARKEAAPSPCNPDQSAPRANVTVLATIPRTTAWENETKLSVDSHIFEIMLALGENARRENIEEIRVVLDDGPPESSEDFADVNSSSSSSSSSVHAVASRRLRADVSAAQQRFSAKLDAMATETQLQKITAHVLDGRQPTYADLFRYASTALEGRVVALMNADVVLQNLDLLDATAFDGNFSLVLTVRSPQGAYGAQCGGRARDRCVNWLHAGSSFDGFVFRTPIPATSRFDLLEDVDPLPVYMNARGAENRAKHFLWASGFDMANPCLVNLAEHWHCSRARMHHQEARVDLPKGQLPPGASQRVPVANYTKGLRCPPPTLGRPDD
mmetsp:Transcript_19247/g.59384  ORF Transcript_19247/g.59384 Transcript_19247/m.59384 type:complete len:341 (+) Transcript_19247:35-1057(+)